MIVLPVLVSICLIYDAIGEDPALLPKQEWTLSQDVSQPNTNIFVWLGGHGNRTIL